MGERLLAPGEQERPEAATDRSQDDIVDSAAQLRLICFTSSSDAPAQV